MVFPHIKPKEVSIFIEDGVPYMKYIGTLKDEKAEYEICFPKISLELEADIRLGVMTNSVATIKSVTKGYDKIFSIKCVKRNMTMEDIEKVIGCKVNIID